MRRWITTILFLFTVTYVFADIRHISDDILPSMLHIDSTDKPSKELIEQIYLRAEQGDADAQAYIAMAHIEGIVLERDYNAAIYWAKAGAKQGHAESQYILGRCLYLGTGVKENRQKAIHYFNLALKQGLPAAQYTMGMLYIGGKEVVTLHEVVFILGRPTGMAAEVGAPTSK